MKNIIFFLVISFVLVISCKEESITPIPETTATWVKVADLPGDYIYLKTKCSSIYMVCYKDEYKFAISQDSGKNWQVNNQDFLVKDNGFLSVEGNTFFISGSDGLFESSDNGITWSENLSLRNYINPNDPLLRIPTLNCLDVEGNEIFLGQLVPMGCGNGAHVNGLFYSSDNGNSWVCPSSVETPWRVTAVEKIDNILIVSDLKVLYSDDNFSTWKIASGGSGDVAEFIKNNSRIYAVDYGFIKYSDNKGQNWINCTPFLSNNEIVLPNTFTFNSDKIFVIDNNGIIYYAKQSDLEWKTFDKKLPEYINGNHITLFTIDNDYVYCVNGAKLWKKKITD